LKLFVDVERDIQTARDDIAAVKKSIADIEAAIESVGGFAGTVKKSFCTIVKDMEQIKRDL